MAYTGYGTIYGTLQVGGHKGTDGVHLVVYQVNQLSLGLQKTVINHEMNAVCFPVYKVQYIEVHIRTYRHVV